VCSRGSVDAIQKKYVSVRQNSKSDSPAMPLAAQLPPKINGKVKVVLVGLLQRMMERICGATYS
jgi:hypothetical protein